MIRKLQIYAVAIITTVPYADLYTSSLVQGFTSCVQFIRRPTINKVKTCTDPSLTRLRAVQYGRGSEIWPECNVEGDGIKIEDSFPDGWTPSEAIRMNEKSVEIPDSAVSINNANSRAEAPIHQVFLDVARSRKVTCLAGFFVFLRGLIRPADLLFVTAFSGYVILLVKSNLLERYPPAGHGAL